MYASKMVPDLKSRLNTLATAEKSQFSHAKKAGNDNNFNKHSNTNNDQQSLFSAASVGFPQTTAAFFAVTGLRLCGGGAEPHDQVLFGTKTSSDERETGIFQETVWHCHL